MNTSHFTREQAEMICYQYQHLVGQPYLKEQPEVASVECIAVSPFDNLHKWLFVYLYEDDGDPENALSFYEAPEYDIIVISRVKGEITFRDLRTYLGAGNMNSGLQGVFYPNMTPRPGYTNHAGLR